MKKVVKTFPIDRVKDQISYSLHDADSREVIDKWIKDSFLVPIHVHFRSRSYTCEKVYHGQNWFYQGYEYVVTEKNYSGGTKIIGFRSI